VWWSPFVAQAAPSIEAAAPWLTLVNLGVAGLVIYLFLRGKLHSDAELEDMRAQRDAAVKRAEDADVKLAESNLFIRTEVMEALSRSAAALVRTVERKAR
jgi:hypothetical protein